MPHARVDGPRRAALLIDNRRELTEAWERAGGAAYWYRDDTTFERDASELLN